MEMASSYDRGDKLFMNGCASFVPYVNKFSIGFGINVNRYRYKNNSPVYNFIRIN